MTHEDAMKKLDALCSEYNIDNVGKTALLMIIASARDTHDVDMALRMIEEELEKRGPKEPQAADNFNVTRCLAVINARSDLPVFELIGNFSIETNVDSELGGVVEVAPGVQKREGSNEV